MTRYNWRDEAHYTVTPAKAWLYVLLIAAWLVPGLAGHDPWKPDEAETFGPVLHVLSGNSWVVPMLAGEPFLEAPPLYTVTAAMFAKVFGGVMPVHDAVRLTSGFFVILAMVFLKLSARRLLGPTQGWMAVLLFIGCVGLLVRAHLIAADNAALAGFAIALYGFSLALTKPAAGGLLLGIGTGITFLAKGVYPPAALLIAALLLPAVFPAWRSRSYALAAAVGLVALAPLIIFWPALLHQESPALFDLWFRNEVVASFSGITWQSAIGGLRIVLEALLWGAWPALPVALWTLWDGARQGLSQPAVQLGVATFGALFALFILTPHTQALDALPMLLPVALIASAGLHTLRRGPAAALDWFGIMTFGLFAALIWLGWVYLVTGVPEFVGRRSYYFRSGGSLDFQWWRFLLAATMTAGWIGFVWRVGRGNRRALINWAAGITLTWMLAMTLWLPWMDRLKTYRPVALGVARHLPPGHGCVESRGLAQAPRAMLQYVAGIVTKRLETSPPAYCDFLLLQSERDMDPGPQWKRIWEGRRAIDKTERFQLYRRVSAG